MNGDEAGKHSVVPYRSGTEDARPVRVRDVLAAVFLMGLSLGMAWMVIVFIKFVCGMP